MKYAWWYQDEDHLVDKDEVTIMIGYESELTRPSWYRDWLLMIADDYEGNREDFANMIVNAMNKDKYE